MKHIQTLSWEDVMKIQKVRLTGLTSYEVCADISFHNGYGKKYINVITVWMQGSGRIYFFYQYPGGATTSIYNRFI